MKNVVFRSDWLLENGLSTHAKVETNFTSGRFLFKICNKNTLLDYETLHINLKCHHIKHYLNKYATTN